MECNKGIELNWLTTLLNSRDRTLKRKDCKAFELLLGSIASSLLDSIASMFLLFYLTVRVELFVSIQTFLFLYAIWDYLVEELGGPTVSALGVRSWKFMQRWLVVGCVTKNVLARAFPYFGRHVKPLVRAAFVDVSIRQCPLSSRGGLWPVLLMWNP
jgi:hypothetical protein